MAGTESFCWPHIEHGRTIWISRLKLIVEDDGVRISGKFSPQLDHRIHQVLLLNFWHPWAPLALAQFAFADILLGKSTLAAKGWRTQLGVCK